MTFEFMQVLHFLNVYMQIKKWNDINFKLKNTL